MDIAIWIIGAWFVLSLIASPMIGVLCRANETPPKSYRQAQSPR